MCAFRLSQRIPADQKKNLLAQALHERPAGKPLLDLISSNPTTTGLAPSISSLWGNIPPKALDTYSPNALGSASARASLARALSEDRGHEVDPEDLVLLSSTSDAYGLLFRILANPGDEVLVPTPSYPLFDQIAGLEGLKLRRYSLRYASGDWYLDRSSCFIREEHGPGTAAILCVHPNNPTGSYLSKEEADFLQSLANNAKIPLVVDEVFYEYKLRQNENSAPSFIRPSESPTITLGGMSKALCLPQQKLSWIHLSGPEGFRQSMRQALEYAADAYLNLSGPAQAMLPQLMDIRHEVQGRVTNRLKSNLKTLEEYLRESPLSLLAPSGGWYAILHLPPVQSDLQWALNLLEAEDILVHPGYLFDLPQEAHLVLSLIVSPEIFQEGLARMLNYVNKQL